MRIHTTRFGDIEFPEEVMLHFPEGILGFPNGTNYVLLEHVVDNTPFKWLQSADYSDLAFIVLDPLLLVSNYSVEVKIDRDTIKMIKLKSEDQCAFMAIVNVPTDNPGKMTANLKSPLVVNSESRLGRQVIIGSQKFSIVQPVFPRPNNPKELTHERQAEIA